MFTRCPQCNTVFRISATQLRVAGGDVRCGNCAHVFNALGLLSDELPEDEGQSVESGDPSEETDGKPDEQQSDSELEFDAPEPTWSQFFIDATRKAGTNAVPAGEDGGDVPLDGELETITADPDEWRAFLDEMDDAPATSWEVDDMAPDVLGREQQVYVVGDEPTGSYPAKATMDLKAPGDLAPVPPFADSGEDESDVLSREDPQAVTAGTDGFVADDHPADDYLADDFPRHEQSAYPEGRPGANDNQHDPGAALLADGELDSSAAAGEAPDLPEPDWRGQPAAEPGRSALWLAASLVMLALLLAQAIHLNRDSLATDEGFGPRLRNLYAELGRPLYPEWPLESYSVRRAEAMAGGSAPESLDISAAVETTGRGSLGLPLVRVALRDQWANVVASRVFTPGQYLPEPLPEVVPAGTRIPVRLSVVDPGSEARGFVVDLCLPRRSGLDCQLNRDPFSP